MNLTINGEAKTSSAETLGALVDALGMKPDRVAIELNREIVPRDQWVHTALHEGDRLEIVHFVGGGTPSTTCYLMTCHPQQTVRRPPAAKRGDSRFGNPFPNLLP